MKQKRMKGIAVALIALLIVGAAVVSLKVEPAKKPLDDGSVQTGQMEEDGNSDQSDDGQNEVGGDGEDENRGDGQNRDGDSQEGTEAGDLPEDAGQSDDGKSGDGRKQPGGQTAGDDEKQPVEAGKKTPKCTFEIRCDTLTDTSKVENEAILPYIPSDGTVLAETEVEFTEGDTVFDALQKVCRDKDVQMEFRNDKLYTGGAYIEGIGYLYEFDGGPLSGWMYKVNGQFPNYGCAGYTLKDGDKVVWVYTCDLGADVGDNSTW